MSRGALVVPVFNEALRFNPSYWNKVQDAAGVRLHFVNDGSTDGTTEILEAACSNLGATVHHLTSNVGKANAVRLGLLDVLAEGWEKPVGFIDADGVFDATDVEQLLTLVEDPDLAEYTGFFSSRVALSGRIIDRRASRHYIGRAVATVLSTAYTPMPYDSQSGLKFFRPSGTLERSLRQPFTTKWFFEMELLIRWRQETGEPMKVWEEPVASWFDAPGSKITGRESFRVPAEIYRVLALARRK